MQNHNYFCTNFIPKFKVSESWYCGILFLACPSLYHSRSPTHCDKWAKRIPFSWDTKKKWLQSSLQKYMSIFFLKVLGCFTTENIFLSCFKIIFDNREFPGLRFKRLDVYLRVCYSWCCSVSKLSLTLWDPMDCSMPGFPVLVC